MTTILCGDALTVLKTLPDCSVQCTVTSPPYWGLRDYGTATWEGGDPDCEHLVGGQVADSKAPGAIVTGVRPGVDASYCRKCGAVRVDQQLGLEKTPHEYVENLVAVFREVKRVLREDGVVFLNLGDSYCSPNGRSGGGEYGRGPNSQLSHMHDAQEKGIVRKWPSLKPKDLIGIPWRVAFALQNDGWWLRSEITWCKVAPMPESVTDRPTSATEKVFLLTKSAKYFYDSEAVKVSSTMKPQNRFTNGRGWKDEGYAEHRKAPGMTDPSNRNLWNYWLINPDAFSGAHFATMPRKLAETCILAGTSEAGCCSQCGKPLERIIEKDNPPNDGATDSAYQKGMAANRLAMKRQAARERGEEYVNRTKTIGFRPACTCNAPAIPCTVLDPFGGSGTTGEVAQRLGRDAILIELNPNYLPLIDQRTRQSGLALA